MGYTQSCHDSSSPASLSVSSLLTFLPPPVRHIGLFVDVHNVFHAEREVRARVDWSALLADLQQVGELAQTIAYLAEHVGNIRRATFLERLGFRLVAKEIKRSGHRLRADLDVDLGVGVIRSAPKLNVSFVACGDSDLTPAWDYAQELGTTIVVLGFEHSTAQALRAKFLFIPLAPWLVPYRRSRSHPYPRFSRREAA